MCVLEGSWGRSSGKALCWWIGDVSALLTGELAVHRQMVLGVYLIEVIHCVAVRAQVLARHV
jgi:hypothetical protein